MTSENLEEWDSKGGEPAPHSFMLNHDSRGSLATRDIVARAADQEMKKTGENCIWLVTSHLEKDEIQLAKSNDEVVVQIGGFRQHIPLPRSLTDKQPSGARLVENRLVITFSD